MVWERRKRDTNIMFAVTYDNGQSAYVTISPKKLQHGDHLVRQLLREHQEQGSIPNGQIASVKRVR
ncbi:MAG TPA: hypothetical protein VHN20_18870 [Beijerinckiaceae bacterium]|nr:hypothetical protein [Beijerinckiaceae bacterium]